MNIVAYIPFDSNHKRQLGLVRDIEIAVPPGFSLQPYLILFLEAILLHILFRSLKDHLSLSFAKLRAYAMGMCVQASVCMSGHKQLLNHITTCNYDG